MLYLFTILSVALFAEGAYGSQVHDSRIIGGSDAGPVPYQVSVQTYDGRHFCGGSIVGAVWILTAAHCTSGWNPNSVIVLVGTNTLNAGGTRHRVAKIICHPNFNKDTLQNDICLLKLTNPVQFSNSVQYISLCAREPPVGTEVLQTGWGYTRYPGPIQPNRLQWLRNYIISIIACKHYHANSRPHGPYTSEYMHVCILLKEGYGTCMGDSGGPIAGPVNGKWTQYGLASWVVPCARGLPDVYTNVCRYLQWILNTANNN